MCLGKVLARRSLTFVEIRHGIESQPVDAHLHPEVERLEDGFFHLRVVEVQVGLMVVEAVPVIRARDRIPAPVRALEILEDDARLAVLVWRIAPDVEVAVVRSRLCRARSLKPWVLIRCVIDDELGDDSHSAAVSFLEKDLEVTEVAVDRIDLVVIGDVVAVILERRWIEREQPERRDAEVLEVIELLGETGKVANAVSIAVIKRTHMELVDDAVLVPERIGFECGWGLFSWWHWFSRK